CAALGELCRYQRASKLMQIIQSDRSGHPIQRFHRFIRAQQFLGEPVGIDSERVESFLIQPRTLCSRARVTDYCGMIRLQQPWHVQETYAFQVEVCKRVQVGRE